MAADILRRLAVAILARLLAKLGGGHQRIECSKCRMFLMVAECKLPFGSRLLCRICNQEEADG